MFTRRTQSISLDAPPEAVFAVLTDYSAYAVWMPGVAHSRVLSVDHELGIAYAELVWPAYLRQEKFSVEFLSEPHRSVAFHQTDRFQQRGFAGRWDLAAAADGRTVVVTGEMRLTTGPFKWLANRRKLRAMLDASLDALRRRVAQGGATGLQEGENGKVKLLEVTTRRDSLEVWLFGQTYEFKRVEGTSWHDQEIRGNQGSS